MGHMTSGTRGQHRPPRDVVPTDRRRRSLSRIFRSILGVGDALEVIVVVGLGTALFLGLTVVLPIWFARELFRTSQTLLGAGVLALSGLTIGCAVRDGLRRRWSAVSTVVAALWITCVLFVLIKLA